MFPVLCFVAVLVFLLCCFSDVFSLVFFVSDVA